jgi:hypothetical protein
MRTIFVAFREHDNALSRQMPPTPVGFFEHQADAKQAALGLGEWGVGDGPVREAKLYASYDEYVADEQGQLRAKALAKLTTEELRVLGLL